MIILLIIEHNNWANWTKVFPNWSFFIKSFNYMFPLAPGFIIFSSLWRRVYISTNQCETIDQVETWSSEARINAAACILQVFKLKGNIDKIFIRNFTWQICYPVCGVFFRRIFDAAKQSHSRLCPKMIDYRWLIDI